MSHHAKQRVHRTGRMPEQSTTTGGRSNEFSTIPHYTAWGRVMQWYRLLTPTVVVGTMLWLVVNGRIIWMLPVTFLAVAPMLLALAAWQAGVLCTCFGSCRRCRNHGGRL